MIGEKPRSYFGIVRVLETILLPSCGGRQRKREKNRRLDSPHGVSNLSAVFVYAPRARVHSIVIKGLGDSNNNNNVLF